MSMFDNYGNNSYTAYNLTTPTKIKGIKTNFKTPLYIKDVKGNNDKFYWVEGEQFDLQIQAIQNICIPPESIIFYNEEKPTCNTVGYIGQKCYNLSTYTSWTCTEVDCNDYTWVQDCELEHISVGGEVVNIIPSMYGKTLKVLISNFRHEVIYDYEVEDDSLLSIRVGEETPDLRQGQYFIDVYIIDSNKYFVKEFNVTILGNLNRLSYSTLTDKCYVFNKTIQEKDNNIVWIPIEDADEKEASWYPITDCKEYELEWYSLNDVVNVDVSGVISNTWSTIT